MTATDPTSPGVALLERECRLARTGDGVYERDCGRLFWGHEAQFGGYAMSLAITALTAEIAARVEAPMALQHCTMQFLRPFLEGSFRAEVTVERVGRTMANTTARLWSAGKLAGLVLASFGVRRPRAEFVTPAMPAVAPIGADEAGGDPFLDIPTHRLFEMFPRLGDPREHVEPHEAGAVGGWIRPFTPELVDDRLCVCLADMWPPAAYHVWSGGVIAQSVDITYHARTSFPDTLLPPGTPMLVVVSTKASAGGFVDEDVDIWSPDGRLVAHTRQMRYVH